MNKIYISIVSNNNIDIESKCDINGINRLYSNCIGCGFKKITTTDKEDYKKPHDYLFKDFDEKLN